MSDQDNPEVGAPFPACFVGRYILDLHQENSIAHMGLTKLLKLVYIAHGFHLAIEQKPLIIDRVEVWPYGPVIPKLHHAIKVSERQKLPLRDLKYENGAKLVAEDKKASGVVDRVVDRYRHNSAKDLTYLTHKTGTPWEESIEFGNKVIYNSIIDNYYKEFLNRESRI